MSRHFYPIPGVPCVCTCVFVFNYISLYDTKNHWWVHYEARFIIINYIFADINDIGQYTCTFVESESKKPAGMVIYNVSGWFILFCPLRIKLQESLIDRSQNWNKNLNITALAQTDSPGQDTYRPIIPQEYTLLTSYWKEEILWSVSTSASNNSKTRRWW